MGKDFSHFKNKDDFINAVALDCITEMHDEDKKTLLNNPDASLYHFSYGMHIRNIYLYPYMYKFRFPRLMMDSLSTSIIEKIIALLKSAI